MNFEAVYKLYDPDMDEDERESLRNKLINKKDLKVYNETFTSDIQWVSFMNNKLFVYDLMNEIIKDSGRKDVVFGGSAILSDDSLQTLKEEETIDLVSSKMKSSKNKKKGNYQDVYTSYALYLEDHPSEEKGVTIYFVGDASGEDQYISIHWNCYIVDRVRDEIVWFDPADEDNKPKNPDDYDFAISKKNTILTAVTSLYPLPIFNYRTANQPQQYCHPVSPAMDTFCQTWVIFFASAYLNDYLDSFYILPFNRISNEPLKLWIKCVISSMKDYAYHFKGKEYAKFLSHIRLYTPEGTLLMKKLPNVAKVKVKNREPCIKYVLDHYLDDPQHGRTKGMTSFELSKPKKVKKGKR